MLDSNLIITELKDSVGNKNPIEYFKSLSLAFELLFDKLDSQQKQIEILKCELSKVKTHSALSIQWEPKVALDLISKQIEVLRKDKDTYVNEISELKKAYTEDRVTQNYHDFVNFWLDTLGFHPFLES